MITNNNFLSGEVFIHVEHPNGLKEKHHVNNAVQPAWTNALFQVLCQGYHEPFGHVPGKITFGVEKTDGSGDTTKDLNVGTGTNDITLSNVYDSANRIFYVKLLASGIAGSVWLNEIASGHADGKITSLAIYGSGATVPFSGANNSTAVKLTDTGELSSKISITSSSSVTIEYRVNLPAHSTNEWNASVISATGISNSIDSYTGWGKSFLGGLCDVMTYGYVNTDSGIVSNHGLASHAPTSGETKTYVGNANLRITSCMLHKFNSNTVYNDGDAENGNEDENQYKTQDDSQLTDSTVFKSAFPKSHIELLNSAWSYKNAYQADNQIVSNLTVQTTATNASVGSMQSTANDGADEATLNLSWENVGTGHSASLVPDLLVFYCRTVETGTKGSGASFKYNKLHIPANTLGFIPAYVLKFDALSGFTKGDNINASITISLNPT